MKKLILALGLVSFSASPVFANPALIVKNSSHEAIFWGASTCKLPLSVSSGDIGPGPTQSPNITTGADKKGECIIYFRAKTKNSPIIATYRLECARNNACNKHFTPTSGQGYTSSLMTGDTVEIKSN